MRCYAGPTFSNEWRRPSYADGTRCLRAGAAVRTTARMSQGLRPCVVTLQAGPWSIAMKAAPPAEDVSMTSDSMEDCRARMRLNP
jgi:hypothetical protein